MYLGEACRLELRLVQSANCIKVVNLAAITPFGLARGIATKVSQQQDMLDFLILQMGNFDVILGADFAVCAKVGIFMHYNGLIICKGDQPCFMQGSPREATKSQLISAIQLKATCGPKVDTFLVTLMEVEENPMASSITDPQVSLLIQEFKYVMPSKLPATLPLRHEIEHAIELLPKEYLPVCTPYKMAPIQLVELQKKLDKLLHTCHIHPSHSPFGVLVIFQWKKDGSLQLCVDYRALNKIIVKNKYPVPNVDELFNQLNDA